jgi:hydroxymethylpyrimidine pyrophosphatase-like HAD family hydrolase
VAQRGTDAIWATVDHQDLGHVLDLDPDRFVPLRRPTKDMERVVLVCCDNEGCIVGAKGLPFDLPAMIELERAVREGGWRFSICTGRSVPYVEAMVQLLDLLAASVPMVCEGGAVLYDPRQDRYRRLVEPVNRNAVLASFRPGTFREELGKVVSCSVYPEPGSTVEELYAQVLSVDLAHVLITRSIAAVDVTPAGVDKVFGITAMLDEAETDWTEVLAIGDSWNDLGMLARAGRSACPANAVPEVKAVVDYCSPYPATRGVVDILYWAGSLG